MTTMLTITPPAVPPAVRRTSTASTGDDTLAGLVARAAAVDRPGPGFAELRRDAAGLTRALHRAGRLPGHLVVTETDPFPLVIRTLAHAASVAVPVAEDSTWESSITVGG